MNQGEILKVIQASSQPMTNREMFKAMGIPADRTQSVNINKRLRSMERFGQIRRVGTDPETRCILWEAVR